MQSKLSNRIKTIVRMVDDLPFPVEEVWDLCCDHGQIGKEFLLKNIVVNFVDQVSSITKRLSLQLNGLDIPSAQYKIITADIRKLDISDNEKKKCLIAVGIGADLIIEFLKQQKYIFQTSFILSAHQNNYKLRCYLKNIGARLVSETIVYENNQYYEILLLDNTGEYKIDLVSSVLRDPKNLLKYSDYIKKNYELFKIKTEHDSQFKPFFDEYKILYKNLQDLTKS